MNKKIQISFFMLLLTISFIVFLHNVLLAEVPISIFFKNGRAIEFNLHKIQPWGMESDDRRTVLYSVIDSIALNNEVMAINILENTENVRLIKKDDYFILDFSDIVLRKLEINRFTPFVYKSIFVNLLSERTNWLALQLHFSPWLNDNLLLTSGASFGAYSRKPGYTSVNFCHGIGIEFNPDIYKISLLFNFARSFSFESYPSGSGSYYSSNTYFFSSNIKRVLGAQRKYALLVGANYYMSQVDHFKMKPEISFYIGFGLNLSRSN